MKSLSPPVCKRSPARWGFYPWVLGAGRGGHRLGHPGPGATVGTLPCGLRGPAGAGKGPATGSGLSEGEADDTDPKETRVRFAHRLLFRPQGPDLQPGENAAERDSSRESATLTRGRRACPRKSPCSSSHQGDAFSSEHPDQMSPAGCWAGPRCRPEAPRAPVPP